VSVIKHVIDKRDQILNIASHYNFYNVKLFGSVLREEENPESDIDFLVDCGEDCSLFDLISLKYDLEEMLGRKIDVVTSDSVHWTLRDKLLQEARPL
jgi:predicted nucleotidyltransferase